VYHIDRGYEDLAGKLRALGAEVARSDDARTAPEPPASLQSREDEAVRSA
jgi:hypothetical protein